MAYAILGNPKPAFFDSSGSPLVSGTITTQDPTDDSVKASYPTAADADAGTNGTSGDITLDARGEPTSTQYWGRDGEDYKVIIKDSAAATVYTLTNIVLPSHTRRAAVVFTSTDATPTIAESNFFKTAGSTTITDFDDGVVGDVITIQSPGTAITVQDNAAILLNGNADFQLTSGDTLTLGMLTDQIWSELSRSYANSNCESVTATNVITEGENGKTFFLNAAGGFTSTLPAPSLGLNFKFIVTTAPTTAYIITTNASANIIYGLITDINATTPTQPANAEDTINFVANTSLPGDYVEVVSDGTNWYMKAATQADGGITVAVT